MPPRRVRFSQRGSTRRGARPTVNRYVGVRPLIMAKPSSSRRTTLDRQHVTYYKGKLSISGFPDVKIAKLRYVDATQVLNTGAGVVSSQSFRANSIFDPDITGVGHQPMYRDQWAALYDKYIVLESIITVKPMPIGSVNIIPTILGIMKDNSAAAGTGAFTTINNILENEHCSGWRYYGGPYQAHDDFKISKKMIPHRFLDVEPLDNQLESGIGSNPNLPCFFTVFMAAIGGNNPDALNFAVTIDYVVRFFEKHVTDGS